MLIFDLDDTLYDLSEPFRRSHTELFGEILEIQILPKAHYSAGRNVIWYNHRHREFPAEGNSSDFTVNTAKDLLEVLKNECI